MSLLPNRLAPPDPFAARPGDVSAVGLPADTAAALGVQLRPIATPLVMTGFSADAIDRVAPMFRAAGMVAVVGGEASAQTMPDGPLQPGDAIGVSLIRGDLSMAGTGTVTLVDEGRVHAFGHPFYSLARPVFR